jgi:CheY-like chemotaxis protein
MARILLIEDVEEVAQVIRRTLEEAGHTVETAVDGEDGVERFRQRRPDLVLCDVFMPRKSGITVLKELRQLDANMPVIVMSGGPPSRVETNAPEVDLRDLARLLGAADTIAKPFRAAELIAIIKRYMPEG